MPHPVKMMIRRLAVLLAGFVWLSSSYAQVLSLEQLLSMATLLPAKSDAYILKKGFFQQEQVHNGDCTTYLYGFTKPPAKKGRPVDSTERLLCKRIFKDGFSIHWQTNSAKEYAAIVQQMEAKGFYCNQQEDSSNASLLLYQHGDITISTAKRMKDSLPTFSFAIYQKSFPLPQDIYYADDLAAFTSHEYLVYFFGEPNVKRDIYYLSGNEMVKCSVLFSNTARQVVFIWADETNRTGISNLLFGGQQRLQSAIGSSHFVGESSWMLKSGVHAGMSLYELRVLNGNDFKFYAGNSANAGAIVPDNSGKLDFKKEDIVLGCMNCNDEKFGSATMLNADEAIADGRIVFVLSVILTPSSQGNNYATAAKLE
jgi:hypothetical protein